MMQAPTKAGQICQLLHSLDDEKPSDVYILAEDPEPFDEDDDVYVVNLNDLQRNTGTPLAAARISVPKSGLNVIAADLEEYIKSWNQAV